VVDTLGLLLAVVVTSAAVDDAAAAPQPLGQRTRREFPRLKVVWADGKARWILINPVLQPVLVESGLSN
jgi:hypothetical protein